MLKSFYDNITTRLEAYFVNSPTIIANATLDKVPIKKYSAVSLFFNTVERL